MENRELCSEKKKSRVSLSKEIEKDKPKTLEGKKMVNIVSLEPIEVSVVKETSDPPTLPYASYSHVR
jgi:hypothetical protein